MPRSKVSQSLDGNEGKIVIAVIGALAIAIFGYIFMSMGPGPGAAKTPCEGFVKDRLSTPASAEFVEVNAEESKGQGSFSVWGEFDADNKFGATVRHEFSCKVESSDDGWKLVDLEIRER